MKVKLKQNVVEKNVVLEEADRIMLANFLDFLKTVVVLLEDEDFYVDTQRENFLTEDLEDFADFIKEVLNENKIVLLKN